MESLGRVSPGSLAGVDPEARSPAAVARRPSGGGALAAAPLEQGGDDEADHDADHQADRGVQMERPGLRCRGRRGAGHDGRRLDAVRLEQREGVGAPVVEQGVDLGRGRLRDAQIRGARQSPGPPPSRRRRRSRRGPSGPRCWSPGAGRGACRRWPPAGQQRRSWPGCSSARRSTTTAAIALAAAAARAGRTSCTPTVTRLIGAIALLVSRRHAD